MSTGQDLGCVGVEGAVIDIEAERYQTCEYDVLVVLANASVSKEECHSNESANNHGIPSSKKLSVAHETGDHGAEDTADIAESIVSPRLVGTSLEHSTTGLQVLAVFKRMLAYRKGHARAATSREESPGYVREEDLVERVSETDQSPGPPEHNGGDGHLLGAEKALDMDEKALLVLHRLDDSTTIQLL